MEQFIGPQHIWHLLDYRSGNQARIVYYQLLQQFDVFCSDAKILRRLYRYLGSPKKTLPKLREKMNGTNVYATLNMKVLRKSFRSDV